MNNRRITDYLFAAAASNPESPAIYLPDANFITYKQLIEQINILSSELAKGGFANGQRIAIIMPHCLEAVLAFYATTLVATVVPLNPNSSAEELKKYITLAKVNAIIVKEGYSAVVKQVSAEMAIPLIPIKTNDKDNFQFGFDGIIPPKNENWINQACDIAVVLFTSGTTSTPKVVPLTHANLIKTIDTATGMFDLNKDDRSISVIPLFHIYGIVGPLFSSVAVGGSVVFLPAFNPQEFFRILQTLKITWYAASPAIHYAVAEYAERINADKDSYCLRLIRSGGAPLPVKVIEKLKRCFGAVVVQGYGLTETSGLGTCNSPLLGKIKDESVGVPTGCEIGIIDEQERFLPQFAAGEIVIRGENVTKGYENISNSEQIFVEDGWFRTGDQGYFDEDGHLFITGRIKEIINRGGVKISPYEVEEILCRHQDVVDAAVFAAPHSYLGEVPMALVVLTPNSSLTTEQLKEFLSDKILLAKIPVQILFAAKIPKSANGKVQRRLLYHYIQNHPEEFPAKLLETAAADDVEFNNKTEKVLVDIWRELFKVEHISRTEDFFETGGDSLMAEMLFAEIERVLAVKMPADTILANRTIQKLAAVISQGTPRAKCSDFIVPINAASTYPPLFCIHNVGGDVLTYRIMADYLGKEHAVYGLSLNLEAKELQHPLRIIDLASLYIKEMRAVQPKGPYFIAGHSLGGMIAYEISRQLQKQNQEVALLAMLDTRLTHAKRRKPLWEKLKHNYQKLATVPFKQILPYLRQKTLDEIGRLQVRNFMRHYPASLDSKLNDAALKKSLLRYASQHYKPESYNGTITYFNAAQDNQKYTEESLRAWSKLANKVELVQINATHSTIVADPAAKELAKNLRYILQNSGEKCREDGAK
ncbi:MAG: AMP-binding protein [Acidaminococcaceae bacterium]